MGGRSSNSIFWLKRFLLRRYQICWPRSPTILCLKWKWEEEKVQEQSNARWVRMFYAISVFSERWCGLWVQQILLSISRIIKQKQNQEYCITMSWLRGKMSFPLRRSVLLCIRDSCGKNVNEEEMKWHRNNWIIIESTRLVKHLTVEIAKKYLLYMFVRNDGLLIYSM